MLARFGNVTKLNPRDYDRLGAAIVALGNAGASTEAEIAEMAMRIGAAGTQVGLSQPEILGLSNALSSLGMEAEAGGSAISRAFSEMATAVSSGGKDLDRFAQTAGMTGRQFSQLFKTDAASALVAFTDGLGRVKREGGNVFEVLDDVGLGGLRVRDSLLRMAGAGDLVADSIRTGTDAWRENSALTEEAAKRYETTAAKLSILKNNVVDIGISIGQFLLPPLATAAEKLAGFFRKIAEADGFKAKVKIVWTGIKEAAASLADLLGQVFSEESMFGAGAGLKKRVPVDASNVEFVNTEGWVDKLSAALVRAVESVDWHAVGVKMKEGFLSVAEGAKGAFDKIGDDLAESIIGIRPEELIDKHIREPFRKGVDVPQPFLRGGSGMGLLGILEGEAHAAGTAGVSGLNRGLAPMARDVARTVSLAASSLSGRREEYRSGATRLGEGASDGVQTGLRTFPTRVVDAIQRAAAQVGGKVGEFRTGGTTLGTGLRTAADTALRPMPAQVGSRVSAAASAASAQSGAFSSAGSSLGSSLSGGITGALSGIGARVAAQVIASVNSAVASVRAAFGIHSPSKTTEEKIGKPLGEGVVTGWVIGTQPLPEKMKESVRNAIEAARTAVESGREALGTAMDALSSRILRAFDAQTSAWKSASEKKLEALALEEEILQAARRITELTDEVTKAKEARASFSPEEGMSAEQVAERTGQLDQAVLDAEARLAEEQRLQALAAERKRLEELAEQERLDYESRRAERRLRLEGRLAQLTEHFQKEGATVKKALKKIKGIMDAFNVDFVSAGALLGRAFVGGLKSAIQAAGDSSGDLSSLIRRVADQINIPALAQGGIVTGPTLAMIGEAGPEAVIPLRKGMGSSGGGDVHVHFHGGTFVGGDPDRLARDLETPLIRLLQESKRRGGPGLTD